MDLPPEIFVRLYLATWALVFVVAMLSILIKFHGPA